MDLDELKRKLIEVLEEIQSSSALACPLITGATKPIDELDKFDSKIWPVASGMLAASLGVPIPNNVNLFRAKAGKTALSVDQSVLLISKLLGPAETNVSQTVA
jgi:hypothetical protein